MQETTIRYPYLLNLKTRLFAAVSEILRNKKLL